MEPTQQPMFFDTRGNLLIPGVHSPNYVAGASGWSINQDGSAEFNNAFIRGILTGNNYIANTAGFFFYSAAPALGNLIGSITSASGVDGFGNNYSRGYTQYDNTALLFINIDKGLISLGTIVAGVPDIFNAGQIQIDTTGSLYVSGARTAAHPALLIATHASGTAQTQPGNTAGPIFLINSDSGSYITGQIQGAWEWHGSSPGWNAPVLGAGWASGPNAGNTQPFQWRVDAEDNVIMQGALHTTAAAPAATIFTLTAGIGNTTNAHRTGVIQNNGGVITTLMCTVNSTGAVTLTPNPAAAGIDVYFQICAPRGHLG